MRARFGLVPTAVSKILSFKFISRLHFHTGGRQNQRFQSTLLGGREGAREGVTKKCTLCTLLIMLIIMDGP